MHNRGGGNYVGGNFMDLVNFPHLKELKLHVTTLRGDIRDIRDHDFYSQRWKSRPPKDRLRW